MIALSCGILGMVVVVGAGLKLYTRHKLKDIDGLGDVRTKQEIDEGTPII